MVLKIFFIEEYDLQYIVNFRCNSRTFLTGLPSYINSMYLQSYGLSEQFKTLKYLKY